jgi:anti-sigma-K factor RskA
MTTSHNQPCPFTEQAVGWALHALEPDEEIAVLLHVPRCATCRRAVEDADDVLSSLGAAVEQVAPPPSLRSSILAAAAEIPQVPSSGRPASAPVFGPDAPVTPAVAARSRRSWLTMRRLVAASVALVAAVAIGGLAIRTNQLEQQSSALTTQAQRLADLVGRLDSGVRHAVLDSPTTGATAAAVLVVDGKRQVYSVSLPANARDNTYVLWGLRPGSAPTPLGPFQVSADGGNISTVGTVDGSDGFTDYAISLEPGHTAPAAPTTVVAKGPIEA